MYLGVIAILGVFLIARSLRDQARLARGRQELFLGFGLIGLAVGQLVPRPHGFVLDMLVVAANLCFIYAVVKYGNVTNATNGVVKPAPD